MAVPGVRSPLVGYDVGRRLGPSALTPLRARPVDYDPATAVTLGWLTGGLICAAWLHRGGHRSMCSVIRTPWGRVLLGVFLAHLADRLGPLDPIYAASRRIPQRTTDR